MTFFKAFSFARISTAAATLMLLAVPSWGHAQAHFDGNITADYDVSRVSPDGFEEVSSWVSIEAIHNDTPGPARSAPLALVIRLSRSELASDVGFDVAWWPLGSLAPGESLNNLYTELAADDIPAGEYFVHTLLVTDDAWQDVLDSRSEPWTRVWRGGIDLRGELYVDRSSPYEIYIEIPEIRNQLLYDHSLPLELRVYATYAAGPAADGSTLCAFSIDGLAVGDSYLHSGYSCDLSTPLYDDERVHVELREQGAPVGDTASEKYRVYDDSEVYVYAGSLPIASIVLLGLLGLQRQRRSVAQNQ